MDDAGVLEDTVEEHDMDNENEEEQQQQVSQHVSSHGVHRCSTPVFLTRTPRSPAPSALLCHFSA